MKTAIRPWLKGASSNGGLWLASIVLAFGLGFSLVILPSLGADTTPLHSDADKVVVNASGEQGYKVDENVCKAYKVGEPELIPDVGLSYTLKRMTNGISESVIINADFNGNIVNPEFNRHFYNTQTGQQPELAYVTPDGWKCIQERAGK